MKIATFFEVSFSLCKALKGEGTIAHPLIIEIDLSLSMVRGENGMINGFKTRQEAVTVVTS